MKPVEVFTPHEKQGHKAKYFMFFKWKRKHRGRKGHRGHKGTQGTQRDTGDTRGHSGHEGHKGTPGDTKGHRGYGGHEGHKGTQETQGDTGDTRGLLSLRSECLFTQRRKVAETYPLCDARLSRSARRSFASLQKSRQNHRFYV